MKVFYQLNNSEAQNTVEVSWIPTEWTEKLKEFQKKSGEIFKNIKKALAKQFEGNTGKFQDASKIGNLLTSLETKINSLSIEKWVEKLPFDPKLVEWWLQELKYLVQTNQPVSPKEVANILWYTGDNLDYLGVKNQATQTA